MKDKLTQFISNLNGQFVEVSSISAPNQCMDLAYNWVFCLDIPKSTIQQSAAYQVWSNASDFTRQYFELLENKVETIPQVGDLFIMGKTSSFPYGHIGIVIEATQTKMKCFEQNFPTGTNSHIQDRGYTGVVGFLRPKANLNSSLPQWFETLLQEGGLSINDESKIRIYFEKAKRYDEDTRILQEQVKSANDALAEKSLEVSGLLDKYQKSSSRVDELTELYNKAVVERNDLSSQNTILSTRVSVLSEDLEALKIDYTTLESHSVEGLGFTQLITIALRKLFKR